MNRLISSTTIHLHWGRGISKLISVILWMIVAYSTGFRLLVFHSLLYTATRQKLCAILELSNSLKAITVDSWVVSHLSSQSNQVLTSVGLDREEFFNCIKSRNLQNGLISDRCRFIESCKVNYSNMGWLASQVWLASSI